MFTPCSDAASAAGATAVLSLLGDRGMGVARAVGTTAGRIMHLTDVRLCC